jgi:NAD(P)-dependent dehydrogenase (short-subunit alcohol dehydrogenase family)
MKLKGQVALITGAAGEVGKAIAMRLAREGIVVVINDVNLKKAEVLAKRIKKEGGEGFPLRADVSDYKQVKEMVDQVSKRYKTIHILINNAGLFLGDKGRRETIADITPEDWNRFISVNLTGAFYCSKCSMPLMINQNYGAIVNISSQAGKTGGLVNGVHYGASKAGLFGLTKGLAREVASHNIRVNCVAPGRISTPKSLDVPRAFHRNILKQIPLGRLGGVQEVAEGVLFLVSEASSYITGATLDINGGWLMD